MNGNAYKRDTTFVQYTFVCGLLKRILLSSLVQWFQIGSTKTCPQCRKQVGWSKTFVRLVLGWLVRQTFTSGLVLFGYVHTICPSGPKLFFLSCDPHLICLMAVWTMWRVSELMEKYDLISRWSVQVSTRHIITKLYFDIGGEAESSADPESLQVSDLQKNIRKFFYTCCPSLRWMKESLNVSFCLHRVFSPS